VSVSTSYVLSSAAETMVSKSITPSSRRACERSGAGAGGRRNGNGAVSGKNLQNPLHHELLNVKSSKSILKVTTVSVNSYTLFAVSRINLFM